MSKCVSMLRISRTALILPATQVVLSGTLIWWAQALERASLRHCDVPGPGPAFLVTIAINAPVNLGRIFWNHWLPYTWGLGVWLAGVGLLWYWVARTVDGWRQQREALIVRPRLLRVLVDILLIVAGLLFLAMGASEVREGIAAIPSAFRGMTGCFGAYWWSEFLSRIIAAGAHFGWSATLAFVFARDLIDCVRRKSPVRV
jgi:hypothetical protein